MNHTSDIFGQGDFEAVPEADAAASPLPRSMGQISLLDNANDTESNATLTNLDQTSSSSSTLPLVSSTAVLVDRAVYRYELDLLRLQVKCFTPDDISPVLISANLAKKIISQGLLALYHPNPISATMTIVTILEQRNEIPAADASAFLDAMFHIDQTKAVFDEARSARSAFNWSSLFVEE